jgi:hypothetical protein
MMNKSLRGRGRESSRKTFYGFQLVRRRAENAQKKSRRFRRLLKLITGRRQTEWTGATRCPNEDAASHKRESLMNRKERKFFQTSLAMSANGRAAIQACADLLHCFFAFFNDLFDARIRLTI